MSKSDEYKAWNKARREANKGLKGDNRIKKNDVVDVITTPEGKKVRKPLSKKVSKHRKGGKIPSANKKKHRGKISPTDAPYGAGIDNYSQ